MGSLIFTLCDYHYIDLNGKYILPANNAVPASEIKSHISLSECYECVLLSLLQPMDQPTGIGMEVHR